MVIVMERSVEGEERSHKLINYDGIKDRNYTKIDTTQYCAQVPHRESVKTPWTHCRKY